MFMNPKLTKHPKNPYLTAVVSTKISEDLKRELDKISLEEKLCVSALIRKIIEQWIGGRQEVNLN